MQGGVLTLDAGPLAVHLLTADGEFGHHAFDHGVAHTFPNDLEVLLVEGCFGLWGGALLADERRGVPRTVGDGARHESHGQRTHLDTVLTDHGGGHVGLVLGVDVHGPGGGVQRKLPFGADSETFRHVGDRLSADIVGELHVGDTAGKSQVTDQVGCVRQVAVTGVDEGASTDLGLWRTFGDRVPIDRTRFQCGHRRDQGEHGAG